MGPYYEHVCAKFGWPVDAALLEGMKAKNAAELAALVAKKEDAEKNQGDMEVLDALFDAVKFHARVGAKAEAVYESVFMIINRSMEDAAAKLISGVATFTCVELCTYPEFVFYASSRTC
ncbi:hypothetical protein JL722_12443 [Aureococcus anophagefferens]|nr:hypothetical protein JL722_12443 [Aureococcus anophagefferens]